MEIYSNSQKFHKNSFVFRGRKWNSEKNENENKLKIEAEKKKK